MKKLIILILLLPSLCFSDGWFYGAATVSEDYSDILFWFNAEANDTADPYTMGASECSSIDTTGTIVSAATISSTQKAVGTYAGYFPSTADYFDFGWGSVSDGIVMAGWFYLADASWPDTTETAGTCFFKLHNQTTARFIEVQPDVDADTNEIALLYRDNAGTYLGIKTDNADLQLNTWYAVQVTISSSTPLRKIEIFDTDLNLLDSAQNTSAFTVPSAGYESVIVGGRNAAFVEYFVDNVLLSEDITRNFITDTVGGVPLIKLTSKVTGACP